jgi:hypothetical protein
MLKLPTTTTAKCESCGEVQETTWNQFGSLLPCIACNAAPVFLGKVSA